MNQHARALTALGLSMAAGLAACSIRYGLDIPGAFDNTCTDDADCGAGSVCQLTTCVASAVDLRGLIVEVRPIAGATFGASSSFLFALDDTLTHARSTHGVHITFDGKLPQPFDLSASKAELDYASECALPAGTSYPAKITLERIAAFKGFHFEPLTLQTGGRTTEGPADALEGVSPDSYNVYVEPEPIADCSAPPPPPVLFPRWTLLKGNAPTWKLPRPFLLKGEIQTPEGGDLTGWRLDVIDRDTGQLISTLQTLAPSMKARAVTIALAFSWLDLKRSPFVRLRPPEGDVTRPSLYWGLLEALPAISAGNVEVHLSAAKLPVNSIKVDMQTIALGDGSDPSPKTVTGVPASVEFQSAKFDGSVSSNATFGVPILDTDPHGEFKTHLVPGATYHVRVRPKIDDTLAITEADVTLPPLTDEQRAAGESACFCGQTITVRPKASVRGSIVTPTGAAFVGANISFEPSQSGDRSYWERLHALPPILPRQVTATSVALGLFSAYVDPGHSDVIVRPSAGSSIPWLVRPRVEVKSVAAAVDLGVIKMPPPVILEGTLTDPGGAPVVSAYVNVWLPVSTTPTGEMTTDATDAVIQIAAPTTTDETGHYRFVLPATIDR
jgi:hypothetical protein